MTTPTNNNVQIMAGAVVCVEAELFGDVKIGTKTIIHPCAKIDAKNGPIIIGDLNIIEERANIINLSTDPLVIGSHNVFEVGSQVMAKSVGDHNVFETKCFVGENVIIPNGCVFGAGTFVGIPEKDQIELDKEGLPVPENSVFFGEPLKHRIAGEKPAPQTLQIDFLNRILPNYHHIRNPTVKKDPE